MMPDRSLVVAGAAAVVAAFLFSTALVRGWRVDSMPEGQPFVSDPADTEAEDAVAFEPFPEKAVVLAADHDPFQIDRRRPAERYRLPGEYETVTAAAPEPPPPPPFRVIGTAIMPTGGLAVVQVEETTPRVIALGEALLGYTLESVDSESATLVGHGRSLTVPVTKQPAPEPPREARSGRGRVGAGTNARDLEAGRAAQMLEILRRQMQERGLGDEIQLENGRIMIRPMRRDTL